jgi:hypothetical protein
LQVKKSYLKLMIQFKAAEAGAGRGVGAAGKQQQGSKTTGKSGRKRK